MLIGLIVLVVLLFLWRTVLWRPRALAGLEPRVLRLLGHRGVRGTLAENTLPAFRAAFEAGLDGVEFDVQGSRDGALVLYHNFELDDGRDLSQLSLQELREVNADMPSLGQLFTLAGDYPGTLLNLEIKSKGVWNGGLELHIARCIRDFGLGGRVLVSSFNPFSLFWLRLVAPELRAALLFSPDLPAVLRSGTLAGWLHVDAVHPQHQQVDEALMRRCKQRGLLVNTWTVNDPGEVKRLMALRVDGIIGDNPEALKYAAGRGHT